MSHSDQDAPGKTLDEHLENQLASREIQPRSRRYGVVSFACRTSTRSITGAPTRS